MVRTCAISSERVRSSEAIRSMLTIVVCAMRAFSVASRAAISASSTARARSLARRFGAMLRPAHLDVAFLFEAGGLALALDLQRLTLGVEVAGTDLDHRILFDVVAQLALGLDVLHQAGQALGVEPVRRVEIFQVGLVEIGDGDRLQLKPVLGERLGSGGLEPHDVLAALLV